MANPASRLRHRFVLLPAVALAVSACGTTVDGTGSALRPPSSPTAVPSFPSTSAAAPTPATTSTARPPGAPAPKLQTLLMPPPAGSTPWTSAWARVVAPTSRRFVAEVYRPAYRESVLQELSLEGLQQIVHRTWDAVDADQADLLLFRFATADGATERYRFATQAKASDRANRRFVIPGITSALGFAAPKVDSLGNVPSIVYAVKGRYVVELFYYSPGRLRTADAIAWMKQQVARLP